jgi:16S rRNA processing protein RimM
VLGAWGVHGQIKVQLLAPESALARGRAVRIAGREHEIERSAGSGLHVRLKLRDINTREEAQGLRGAYLEVPEAALEALPEGEYYRFQLVGLAVRSTDGREFGLVTDVLSAPENDVYVVSGPFGEVLVPAVDDVVQEVDLEARVILIEIVPGLLP